MPYIENRLVHDADAHIMETPHWLRDYADPALRDRIEPPGYVNELRSFTQGRAQYSMQFSHYDEVPANVAQEVKEKLA